MDNPQAFPGGWPEAGYEPCYGMTLRDWFAGQALCSIPLRNWDAENRDPSEVISAWAKSSYAIADAMLAERSKGA